MQGYAKNFEKGYTLFRNVVCVFVNNHGMKRTFANVSTKGQPATCCFNYFIKTMVIMINLNFTGKLR